MSLNRRHCGSCLDLQLMIIFIMYSTANYYFLNELINHLV